MRPPFILVSSSYLNAFRRAAERWGPSYRLNPIIGEQNIYLSACQDFNGLHLHCYLSFPGQVARLEAKSAAAETAEEARRKYASVLIRANEMVESIKQAIVLLQIAKNAAAPDEPGAVKEFNGAIDALTKSGREGRSTMEHTYHFTFYAGLCHCLFFWASLSYTMAGKLSNFDLPAICCQN